MGQNQYDFRPISEVIALNQFHRIHLCQIRDYYTQSMQQLLGAHLPLRE